MRLYKLKKCKRIHGLHFTHDNRQLMVASGVEASGADRATWLDLASGEVVNDVPLITSGLLGHNYALAPDHSRLVMAAPITTALDLPNLIHWRVPHHPEGWRTQSLRLDWPAHTFQVSPLALALSADGNRLVVSLGYQRITGDTTSWWFSLVSDRFDRTDACERIHYTDRESVAPAKTLAFAPDGEWWAAGHGPDHRAQVSLQRTVTTRDRTVSVPGNRVERLIYSPDGTCLAATVVRKVVLLDVPQFTIRGVLDCGSLVYGVAFATDGKTLLSATFDGTVRVWDSAHARAIASFTWNIGPTTAIAASRDGTLCAVGGKSGQIAVWDAD